MRILVLSKYSRNGASSRYRMFQYLPYLESKGVSASVEPLFDDDYLERLYSKKNRLLSVLKAYLRRAKVIFFASNFDLVWIEKELFPWAPWFLEFFFFRKLKSKYVVDYDDAIFHQYDKHRFSLVRKLLGKKIDRVMKNSVLVVAGNEYLAARARQAGSLKVVEIPTVVSENIFTPKEPNNKIPILGWIGSMSTAIYLEKVRPILAELAKSHSFVFRVVGAKVDWPEVAVEMVPWSEDEEVGLVQSFDIGIMPLLDSPWERGKCGFKLIQYMACGKPVVADAVGVNAKIVKNDDSGYLVFQQKDWQAALEKLLVNKNRRSEMGQSGRDIFRDQYSLEQWQSTLYTLLSESS